MRDKDRNLLIAIVAAIVIGPIVIHVLYKSSGPQWLVAEWSAGDLLQYYGMLVTAAIAIYGIYLTFQDNRRGIKEQSRLDKLPYFSLTTLNYKVRNPLFGVTTEKHIDSKAENGLKSDKKKDEFFYKEEKIKYAFLIIEKGKSSIRKELDSKNRNLVINGGISEQVMDHGLVSVVSNPMTYVPIILQNVGNGAALDFRVGFNKLVNGKLEAPLYLSSTSINVDEDFYLGLFSNHDKDENVGEYLLEIVYRDMFDNQYKQDTKIIVSSDDGISVSMEVSFRQRMVNNEDGE